MIRISAFIIMMLPTMILGAEPGIKITGPKEATVGYMCKIKLEINAEDPKIQCFPSNNQDWIASQDFTGQKWIIYVPGKNTLSVGSDGKYIPKIVTFVVAANDSKSTFLSSHEVTVVPDTSAPVPVVPPAPSELTTTLTKAYNQAPSPPNKPKLVSVYEGAAAQAAAGVFQSYAEANNYLATATPKAVGTTLRPLRDAVALELVNTFGQVGSAWDQPKFTSKMNEIAAIIKGIPP